VGGDTHIYTTHIEQVKTQLSREPFEFPTLKINKQLSTVNDIEKLQFSDFQVDDYKSHPSIKAEMAI
jgi:thymidylate synthase